MLIKSTGRTAETALVWLQGTQPHVRTASSSLRDHACRWFPAKPSVFHAALLLVVLSAESSAAGSVVETVPADASEAAATPTRTTWPDGSRSTAERLSKTTRARHELAVCLAGSKRLKQRVRELERDNVRLLQMVEDLQRGCHRVPERTAAPGVAEPRSVAGTHPECHALHAVVARVPRASVAIDADYRAGFARVRPR
jgi:hypothetical protein